MRPHVTSNMTDQPKRSRVHLPLAAPAAVEPALGEGARSLAVWAALRRDLEDPAIVAELREDPMRLLARYGLAGRWEDHAAAIEHLLREIEEGAARARRSPAMDERSAPAPASIPRLRAYLDAIGFANLYRYIVSAGLFHRTPFAVTAATRDLVLDRETYIEGDVPGRLAWALLAREPIARAELTADERALADALAADGLLAADATHVHQATRQLICFDHLYLLVDRRLNFPAPPPAIHDVYIGPDSSSLAYYLGGVPIRPGTRALDLGTGTGVIGLVMADRGASVVSTDIADAPLALARQNRALNRLDDRIELRRQTFDDTLAEPGPWDVIAFNPPFIAAPPEVDLPVFARGSGRDGLDLMRRVLERLPAILAPAGQALFVADLLGTARLPAITEELRGQARDFAIEIYIDDVRPITGHIDTLARGAVLRNGNLAVDEVRASIERLLVGELGATHMHLAVIRVRRGPPGLTIYNRWFPLLR